MATSKRTSTKEKLPSFAGDVAERFPDIWEAYSALGDAAAASGPLTAREQRLVKLALAIGAGSEGATHSHARRGQKEGLDERSMQQVALLGITSLGWSQAMRGLAWIEDVTAKQVKKPKRR